MRADSLKPLAPRVSFCMSTRRRPDFLLKTLKSLQRQTLTDFEAIISDNDPEASARAVVEGLNDPRLHYHCNGTDLGMNASFNRSLALARGEYVVMITDDDPVYPEMLETLRDLSQKHPGYGCYFGGADMLQLNPNITKFTLHRVGTNSCLAPLPYGTVRTYTAEQFPHAFFNGEIGIYMLWSVGMTRREIAQSVGMPNYGSPYLGDFVYTISTCAHSGVVVANQSLGCQTVHDFNFGRKECGQLKAALLGFTDCMTKRFSQRSDWPNLKPKVEQFVAQWMILHCIFLRQYFKHLKITDNDLQATLRDLFTVPFVRRRRFFYYAGAAFVAFQQFQADLRARGLRRMTRSSSAT